MNIVEHCITSGSVEFFSGGASYFDIKIYCVAEHISDNITINIKRKSKQIQEEVMEKIHIDDKIKIIHMEGDPHSKDREGVVTHIDDAGQIHGTWGVCYYSKCGYICNFASYQ